MWIDTAMRIDTALTRCPTRDRPAVHPTNPDATRDAVRQLTRRSQLLAAATTAALLLSACGGTDADEGATDTVEAGDDAAADTGGADTGDAGTGDADTGADGDADDAEAADTDGDTPTVTITAADGWSEPDTTELPPAGTMELDLGGQTYVAEGIQCRGFGEVPDEVMDGPLQLNEFLPFTFEVSAVGAGPEGQDFRLTLSRGIYIEGDRAIQIRNSGWGGDGQLDIVSFSDADGVSMQQTPSSRDPEGSELPLVKISPDGAFTARGELRPEFEGEDEAPDGPYEVRGRCQETWPEPFEG